MAAQGERELGDIVMGEGLLDPMAQDEEVEQEMLGVGEEQFFPPQMDPEPGMGAAAAAEAAVYDTSPPLPHQNPPPIPAETVRPGTPDMAQIYAMLAAMSANMEANTREIKKQRKRNETRNEGRNKKQRERNERGNEKNAG